MPDTTFTVTLLPMPLAICRLTAQVDIPRWAQSGQFFSITRTPDELSIVCSTENVPDGVECDLGWRALKLEGHFPLEMVGILASIIAPLAEAGVSIFVLATYDTDYLLIKEAQLLHAVATLSLQGHTVQENFSH
jgi:hypothetical protein